MVRIRIDPAVDGELDEIVAKYDAIDADLRRRFLDDLESTLKAVSERPDSFQILKRRRQGPEIRRAILHEFPYYVVYSVIRETAYVAAVVHVRRARAFWTRRLQRLPPV